MTISIPPVRAVVERPCRLHPSRLRAPPQWRYLRDVEFRFERGKGPAPWGANQPKFERLVTEGGQRYFLEGRLTTGEPVRVELAPASFRTQPGS
jgi:hypothetical protein